ncbi:MAG: hypothetical protein EAZ99_14625 [Alphaproteobacteria bacterium]|nr:MAG: hypothetical protein EAZ99_14625 [Alphaproteobacteria bacterium]
MSPVQQLDLLTEARREALARGRRPPAARDLLKQSAAVPPPAPASPGLAPLAPTGSPSPVETLKAVLAQCEAARVPVSDILWLTYQGEPLVYQARE